MWHNNRHHRYCRHYHKNGSVSQHDSFDSNGSANGISSSHIIQSRQSSVGLLALPNTASAIFLQRSNSDSQESKRYCFQRQHSKNYYSRNGTFDSNSFQTSKKLSEHNLNCIQRMRRRTSNSLRAGTTNGIFYNFDLKRIIFLILTKNILNFENQIFFYCFE